MPSKTSPISNSCGHVTYESVLFRNENNLKSNGKICCLTFLFKYTMKPTINELLIQDDELTVKRFKNIFKRLNFVKYHLFTN